MVFVSAYDEFAFEAFESAAIDYILKPVELRRQEKTLYVLSLRL